MQRNRGGKQHDVFEEEKYRVPGRKEKEKDSVR
jgi:hypothetical protein